MHLFATSSSSCCFCQCFGPGLFLREGQPLISGYLPWGVWAVSLPTKLGMTLRWHWHAACSAAVDLPWLSRWWHVLLPVPPLCSPGDYRLAFHRHFSTQKTRVSIGRCCRGRCCSLRQQRSSRCWWLGEESSRHWPATSSLSLPSGIFWLCESVRLFRWWWWQWWPILRKRERLRCTRRWQGWWNTLHEISNLRDPCNY